MQVLRDAKEATVCFDVLMDAQLAIYSGFLSGLTKLYLTLLSLRNTSYCKGTNKLRVKGWKTFITLIETKTGVAIVENAGNTTHTHLQTWNKYTNSEHSRIQSHNSQHTAGQGGTRQVQRKLHPPPIPSTIGAIPYHWQRDKWLSLITC